MGSLGQRAGALRASGCAAADERGWAVRENGACKRAAVLLGCLLGQANVTGPRARGHGPSSEEGG